MADVILSLIFAYCGGFCFGYFIWYSCHFKATSTSGKPWVSCLFLIKVVAIPFPRTDQNSFANPRALSMGGSCMWGSWGWKALQQVSLAHPWKSLYCWILAPNPVFTGFKMGEAITWMKEIHLWRSNQRGIWNRGRDRSQGPFPKRSDLCADSRSMVELAPWECVTRGKGGAEGMCKGLGEMFGEKLNQISRKFR